MTELLNAALYEINTSRYSKRKAALELMAGHGRNRSTLEKFYEQIHLLDGSEKMVEHWGGGVTSYHCLLQEFAWPERAFDLVFGCWVLCYLSEADRHQAYAGMKRSLNYGGHLILFEPVLHEQTHCEEQRHSWKEQGMMIRKQLMYTRELESQGFDIIREHLWKKKGVVS